MKNFAKAFPFAVCLALAGLNPLLASGGRSGKPAEALIASTTATHPAVVKTAALQQPLNAELGLRSFVVKPHHVSTLLSWITPVADSNAAYIVQRSLKGLHWESIGAVVANGPQQEYNFWDVKVNPGMHYQYRLLREQPDGGISVSRAVSAEVDASWDEYLLIFGLLGFIGWCAFSAQRLIG